MSALSDLLTSANRSQLSRRAIAREAQRQGYTLNHDTAARYLRGAHGVPDEATLQAFAAVLDIPLHQLRVAAELPSELTTPYVPPVEASRLSRRQRRAVDEIIRAMLSPGRAGEQEPAKPAAAPPAPVQSDELSSRRAGRGRRAARHGSPEPPGAE